MSIQVLCPFLIKLFEFSLLSYIRILNINPLLINGLQIFPPILKVPFTLHWLCPLLHESFWSLISFHFSIFLLLPVLLVLCPRNHCQISCYDIYIFVFFWEFCSVGSYSWILNPFWVNFGIWCKIRIQLHSFACNILSFKYHLFKRLAFSHWMVLASLKSFAHICKGLFLDSVLFHWCMHACVGVC